MSHYFLSSFNVVTIKALTPIEVSDVLSLSWKLTRLHLLQEFIFRKTIGENSSHIVCSFTQSLISLLFCSLMVRIAQIFDANDIKTPFITDNKPIGDEFQNEIKYSVGPQLSLISKDISANSLHFQQQNASKAEETVHEKYIYFNHKNNRFHACLYDSEGTMSHREGRKTEFSSSVMNILCDLYAKEEEKTDSGALISSEKETIVKTFNDYWLVNRTFNNRSLYLILHKSSTLIDVAEESQRLISEIVKNVYFSNQQ